MQRQAINTSPKELRDIADNLEKELKDLNKKFSIHMDDRIRFSLPIVNQTKESDTWRFEK